MNYNVCTGTVADGSCLGSNLTWMSYLLTRGIGLALCAPVASVLLSLILLNQKKGLQKSGLAAASSPLAAEKREGGARVRRRLGSKGGAQDAHLGSSSAGGGSRMSNGGHSPFSAADSSTAPQDRPWPPRPFASFGLRLPVLEPAYCVVDGWMDWAAERVSSTVVVVMICLPIGGISILRVMMSRFGHKVGADSCRSLASASVESFGIASHPATSFLLS